MADGKLLLCLCVLGVAAVIYCRKLLCVNVLHDAQNEQFFLLLYVVCETLTVIHTTQYVQQQQVDGVQAWHIVPHLLPLAGSRCYDAFTERTDQKKKL